MNIQEFAKKHFVRIEFERGGVHECYEFSMEELEQFATLVAAHEREECAKVCDESHGPFLANGDTIANAIRARSKA